MPVLRSAPAPVKPSNAVSPGSAIPTRSGRFCQALRLHLQKDPDRGLDAELVDDLHPEAIDARLRRCSGEGAGLGVELDAGRQEAGLSAEDVPLQRADTARRLQLGGVELADLRGRQ